MKKALKIVITLLITICIIFLVNFIGSYVYANRTIETLLKYVRDDNIEKIYKITGNYFGVLNADQNLNIYDFIELGEDDGVFSLPQGTLKNFSYDINKISLNFPYILFEINLKYANPKTVIATGEESQKLLNNFEEKYLEQINNENEIDWIFRDADNVILIDENNYFGNDFIDDECLIEYNILTHHFNYVDSFYSIIKGVALKSELISQENAKAQEIFQKYFNTKN